MIRSTEGMTCRSTDSDPGRLVVRAGLSSASWAIASRSFYFCWRNGSIVLHCGVFAPTTEK